MKLYACIVMLTCTLSLFPMARSPLASMTVEEFNKHILQRVREEEEQKKKEALISRLKVAQELTYSDEKIFSSLSERSSFIPDYYDHGTLCTLI